MAAIPLSAFSASLMYCSHWAVLSSCGHFAEHIRNRRGVPVTTSCFFCAPLVQRIDLALPHGLHPGVAPNDATPIGFGAKASQAEKNRHTPAIMNEPQPPCITMAVTEIFKRLCSPPPPTTQPLVVSHAQNTAEPRAKDDLIHCKATAEATSTRQAKSWPRDAPHGYPHDWSSSSAPDPFMGSSSCSCSVR
jgi:hypothetical protein